MEFVCIVTAASAAVGLILMGLWDIVTGRRKPPLGERREVWEDDGDWL